MPHRLQLHSSRATTDDNDNTSAAADCSEQTVHTQYALDPRRTSDVIPPGEGPFTNIHKQIGGPPLPHATQGMREVNPFISICEQQATPLAALKTLIQICLVKPDARRQTVHIQ